MDLSKFFINISRRLSNIHRFSIVPTIKSESVAEHCFYVSLYVMMLSKFVHGINEDKALKMALIHDIEEVISGDFPHSTKVKYPEFTEALERMNSSISYTIFKDEIEFIKLWEESRGLETEESRLVSLCDRISVFLYTQDEELMGNKFMSEINHREKSSIISFVDKYPQYKFVRDIIKI